jgi:hypothetical protein
MYTLSVVWSRRMCQSDEPRHRLKIGQQTLSRVSCTDVDSVVLAAMMVTSQTAFFPAVRCS